MPNYNALSEELTKRIEEDRKNGTMPNFAFREEDTLRRNPSRDTANIWRTAFIRDIDKILHCPYYNRYADKTQVFSFYRNDDITRRALHVQLVSRIARTIGKTLNLNLDLIEAIALGHDIGHPPFAHTGEAFLDRIYNSYTRKHFCHSVHSVRVLDEIYPYNISLQTLSGIAGHNGELELSEYYPADVKTFSDLDEQLAACTIDLSNVKKLSPSTLEGCVVRISDIIAYLGKDRQDAARAKIVDDGDYENGAIGSINAEIINNLIVNIIENSYAKPYIKLDAEHFSALKKAKSDNYEKIYFSNEVTSKFDETVHPMMQNMYEKLLSDLETNKKDSPIFTHHIRYVNRAHYERKIPYEATEKNQLVVDYIASMTDDYFVDLYRKLFPCDKHAVEYKGYFD